LNYSYVIERRQSCCRWVVCVAAGIVVAAAAVVVAAAAVVVVARVALYRIAQQQ